MGVKARPAIERLLPRCEEDENGCWVFQGAKTEGYGVVGVSTFRGATDYCHRITYQFFIGEIPEGLELDHLCRNRACCNPWHLEPVTRLVNTARGMRWRLTHCKNRHEYTPENTRLLANGTRRCITCLQSSSRRASAAYQARKREAA